MAAVIWTSIVNAIDDGGGTLRQTGAAPAGGVSTASFPSDCKIEFTVYSAAYEVACGLSVGNTNETSSDIDFAIDYSSDGWLALENGDPKYSHFGAPAINDVFSVERVGTTITYARNGVVFYTSTTASTGALLVDCSLNDVGARVYLATLTGYVPPALVADFVAAYALLVPLGTGFAARYSLFETSPQAGFAARYSLFETSPQAGFAARMALALGADHAAPAPLRLGAGHIAGAPFGLAAEFTASWNLLAPVAPAGFTAPLPILAVERVAAAYAAEYPLRLGADFAGSAALLSAVRAAHAAAWALTIEARAAFGARHDLLAANPVRARHRAIWSLLETTATISTSRPRLLYAGAEIEIVRFDLSCDERSYLWQADIELARPEDYARFQRDEPLTLDLAGEIFALIVEEKSLDRTDPAAIAAHLRAVSPTAALDFPRAQPITRTFDVAVLARAAAEDMLGQAIDWQIVDWSIPAYRLAFAGAAPIEAARGIVEAAGGLLETNPDGTLVARHRYPVSPQNYAGAATDFTLGEPLDILTASEGAETRALVDKLRIRDTVAGIFGDRLEWETGDQDGLSGTLHVYPSPWRDGLQVLHTGPAAISLLPAGTIEREVEELVEIVSGEGRTKYPIHSVVALEWKARNLGGIAFEPYASSFTTTAADEKYSLLRIVYRTRSIDYRAALPYADSAQFLVEDEAA